MRWGPEPYELDGIVNPDGSPMEVSGDTASVMRSLDAFDPTGPYEENTGTWSQTLDEFAHWLGDFRWCAPMGVGIERGPLDLYATVDQDALLRRAVSFLHGRVVWAANASRRGVADKARLKAYAAQARREDTSVSAGRLARDICSMLPIPPDEVDCEPSAIGTPQGVMHLDDGTLPFEEEEIEAMLSGRPALDPPTLAWRVTKRVAAPVNSPMLDVDLEPDPRWEQFVSEVTDGDGEKAAFLQRALGYSMYGGNPEKATFVLWSRLRDCGKSTLMAAVKHALGDYAGSAPAELVLRRRQERDYAAPNTVLAGLKGKRLVDLPEPAAGSVLDGATVKHLASGADAISCRQLHGRQFEYVPEFTLWMHCNALPVVEDVTAIDPEHMFVIEFTRSFAGCKDMTLAQRFSEPRGAFTVLDWLVAGYLEYREKGLEPPRCVQEATEAWLTASGTWLDAFVAECCVLDMGGRCGTELFRKAAEAYRRRVGGEQLTVRAMNRYLRAMNVTETRGGAGSRLRGLSIPPDIERDLLADGEENVQKHVQDGRNRDGDGVGAATIALI
jgi:P4 family phage/plasmid primase-like protien